MPGTGFKFKQIFLNFRTVLLSCELYSGETWPRIRHIQLLLAKMGLVCYLFGLMFREISILLNHYPCNKILSWHAVNQGLS